ncbi:hypothetical protein SAMN06296386_10948 [Lachnospiraceae bacterium]|nr:hypothetical protein SAMN06296386_10948 [Lachnospiraceae bacterium]
MDYSVTDSEDWITYSIRTNGLPVEASYTKTSIETIFIPLLQHLKEMQAEKGGRLIVYLAAPPAAGKSTLASFLKYLSEEHSGLKPIDSIGMDGFHLQHQYLINHAVKIDGKVVPLAKIKGAPPTYDLDGIHQKIREISEGALCKWPFYDRLLHNPVQDAVTVERDIVLIEGNYLLLKDEGWKDLADYADFTIRIIADPDFLRTRLVERKHLSSGKPLFDVEKFVDFSDMRNVRLCLDESYPADLTLVLNPDNSYSLPTD